MSLPKSVGFPRMRNEVGKKRVFLPEFIHYLVRLGAEVYIEEGYGARSGFSFEDYKRADPSIYMHPRGSFSERCCIGFACAHPR
jgi:alanine dehydrogenase